MHFNKWIFGIITGMCMFQATANVFIERPEVVQFLDEIVSQHKLDKKEISLAFSQIEPSEEVIKRMTTQYEALPWYKYKKLLVTDKRINDGVVFWHKHAATLKQAEKQYGVPAQLIVAIIGIESEYGNRCGKFPVLQALATLAFDYPPRAAFFKNELIEYLILAKEHRLSLLETKGSYAGAMGIPQFIASSYRKFAVDFDGSGQIDLINSMPQVIGSVANYFKQHGWKSEEKQVIIKAKTNGSKYKNLTVAARNNPLPELSLKTLHTNGVKPTAKITNPSTKVALLAFEQPTGPEYWLGMHNFYVITRYNHSSNYALAVYELSKAIAKKYKS